MPTLKRPAAVRFGLVISLALLAAACNPATPTPPSIVVLTAANPATATLAPTQPPPLTATATEEVGPVDEVAATATVEATSANTATPGAPSTICARLTEAQAAEVLAEPVSAAKEEADGGVNSCTWLGQTPGRVLILSLFEAGSAEAASAAAQEQMIDTTTVEDPEAAQAGLGEEAYWGTGTDAAAYIVVTGPRAYSLVLGGRIGDPAAHRAALLAAALVVSGGLNQ